MKTTIEKISTLLILSFASFACTNHLGNDIWSDPGYWLLGNERFQVFYNEPGTSEQTMVDKKVDLKLVELLDQAQYRIDMAVYNLGRQSIIDAVMAADERNIPIRLVGDVDEAVTEGYRQILRTTIPFSIGNSTAIHHNKFAVIDSKYLFMGTANFTDTDLRKNNNNFMIIESTSLSRDYTREFEQMYYGRYGAQKVPFTTNHSHMVNFTPVELYFSPYDGKDAMNRIIQLINGAQREIQFMIFAFTHDEMTSALIRAAKRGVLVRGIHDSTFIAGTSEEAPRLYNAGRYMAAGPFNREDGNENTAIPGLKSHGGKLHTKTLIIDGAIVSTGSFNWSNNAVENNDENMMVIHSPWVAQELQKQWQGIWDVSKPIQNQLRHPSGDVAFSGDIVISEVMYAGSYTGTSLDANDDWIEFRNMTNRDIDMSHWTITWDTRETGHYPIPDEFNWYEPGVATRHLGPGRLIIPANGYFLLKVANGAIDSMDNKISGAKNFSLNSSAMNIRLYDVAMNLIDQAGNGDPPVAGKLDSFNKRVHSMERFFHPTTGTAMLGTSPGSWFTSNGNNCNNDAVAPFCDNSGLYYLNGTGQIGDLYRQCLYGGSNIWTQCTIGTPNYSGNSTFPTAASKSYNGINNFTNIPLYAFSTSSTTATIQMRWAMLTVPTVNSNCPGTESFVCGGFCTAPCASVIDPTDSSRLLVTTNAQTQNSIHTLTVQSNGNDVTGGFAAGGSVSIEGHGNANATVRIERVYPSQSGSQDIIVLYALSTGTLNKLGIYYYDYTNPSPLLIYRMGDVLITAGQYIQVTLNQSCDAPCLAPSVTPEDQRLSAIQTYSITANPGAIVSGLAANSTWQVFSPVPGVAGTDLIVFASYDLTSTPMDIMCYSNRDGDIPADLVTGGFRDLATMTSAYNLNGIFPVDSFNDGDIQNACSSYVGGTTGNYLQRNTDSNNGSDFTCVGCP